VKKKDATGSATMGDAGKITGITIFATDRKALLRDITTAISSKNANIDYTQILSYDNKIQAYFELSDIDDRKKIVPELKKIKGVIEIKTDKPFEEVYGNRVIVIGGGAQVTQVVHGAVSEADRHNIRGERISVDTIPLVGEDKIAEAVKSVGKLHRAGVLVLAGAMMGGEITNAVKELKERCNIPIISLKMVGSVPDVCDLVVTDPVEAGVLAVMSISKSAQFDLKKLKKREI
jgi:energy-converting hydrogenase B subunit Q